MRHIKQCVTFRSDVQVTLTTSNMHSLISLPRNIWPHHFNLRSRGYCNHRRCLFVSEQLPISIIFFKYHHQLYHTFCLRQAYKSLNFWISMSKVTWGIGQSSKIRIVLGPTILLPWPKSRDLGQNSNIPEPRHTLSTLHWINKSFMHHSNITYMKKSYFLHSEIFYFFPSLICAICYLRKS